MCGVLWESPKGTNAAENKLGDWKRALFGRPGIFLPSNLDQIGELEFKVVHFAEIWQGGAIFGQTIFTTEEGISHLMFPWVSQVQSAVEAGAFALLDSHLFALISLNSERPTTKAMET